MQRPRLVASDVDGTLLDEMQEVSERTAQVVSKVTASGTPFVLVTGRPPRWIPPVAQAADITGLAVCANGAMIYDIANDRVVNAHSLSAVQLTDVAHVLDEVMPGAHLAVERPAPANPDHPPFLCEENYASPWGDGEGYWSSRGEILGKPAVKLLARHPLMTSAEMAAAAHAVLGDAVTVTFSSNHGLIEISALGITKATGLAETAEMLELDAAGVVAFGDMPNDIEMLRWAGHGVAMANGHQDVLAIADEITAPNVEDGVAQVLERWWF